MADRIRIEIGGRIVPVLLDLARQQGRPPDEIAAEALEQYLRERGISTGPSLGELFGSFQEGGKGSLPLLLDGMGHRFDLDEDEAMRIAVEEQHAHRAERAARRGGRGIERDALPVVVDSNVLVSAAISANGTPRRILDTWRAGFFELCVSYELLHELESVLLRPYFLDRLTYSDVLAYVELLREHSTFLETSVLVPRLLPEGREPVSEDPDDDYLIDLARILGAEYLVSGDSHLLNVEDAPVRILSPRAFWDEVLLPLL